MPLFILSTNHLFWNYHFLAHESVSIHLFLFLSSLRHSPSFPTHLIEQEHCARNGNAKILNKCSLPLTGKGVVDRLITELAVFDVDKERGELVLVEMMPDVTVEELKEKTACDFEVSPDLKTYDL